jgi:hypothetical protein
MRKLSTNIFYVYEHWRLDQDVCFYVGKGKGKRAWDLSCRDGTNSRNRWHKFLIQKLHPRGLLEVRLVFEQLEESHAFQLERERISHWRKLGIKLVNLTDGGEGSSGVIVSEKTRRKLSTASKGRKHTPEARAKISKAAMGNKRGLGQKRTPEQIATLVEFNKNKPPASAETREKMRIAKLGRPLSDGHKEKLKSILTEVYKDENLRKRCIASPEGIERARQANLGKKQTAEHIEKKSNAIRGRKNSEATIQLMRESALRREAKKKMLSVNQEQRT